MSCRLYCDRGRAGNNGCGRMLPASSALAGDTSHRPGPGRDAVHRAEPCDRTGSSRARRLSAGRDQIGLNWPWSASVRSEEHTSKTPVTNAHLVCRLLLEKKKNDIT